MKQNTINQQLAVAADRHGTKTALTFLRGGIVKTEMSYAQLWHDISRFAHILSERGVQKGDRVILFIPKSLIAVVAHYAIQSIGAVCVPLNPGFKKSEMAYLLDDADARLVIAGSQQQQLIHAIDTRIKVLAFETATPYQAGSEYRSGSSSRPQTDIDPDDPALIIYTSGTTGAPKGAVLTHRNLMCDAGNITEIWRITHEDVLCHALPLYHVHGLCFALHTALISGSHVRLLDQFEPEAVVAELSHRASPCTVFMAVPAMYSKLMDCIGPQKMDFSHMRLITSGSAPLLVRDFKRIKDVFGREPVEREGMSETGMNFSNPLSGRRKPGSIGRPLPGLAVRLVDPTTCCDITEGEVGEIWLKSPAITPGYWRKPRETQDAFKDGWFRTGDLGRVDGDGYYYLTDRIKHIIITGGENVSAKEVETVINRIDGVEESAVVGVPDATWGEKVVAAVTLKKGEAVTDEDIKAACKRDLHDWKCPKEVKFLSEFPRNTMGKILKEQIKTQYAQYT